MKKNAIIIKKLKYKNPAYYQVQIIEKGKCNEYVATLEGLRMALSAGTAAMDALGVNNGEA